MKLEAIIVGVSITLTGFIVNVPSIRSRLNTPILRAAAAGLLAAALTVGGMLIERLVVNAR
jgi:hypothetical protein